MRVPLCLIISGSPDEQVLSYLRSVGYDPVVQQLDSPAALDIAANQGFGVTIPQPLLADQRARRIQASIDCLTDAVYWLQSDGRFADANDATCRALGYSRDRIVGMPISEVLPNLSNEWWGTFWSRLKAQRSIRLESHHRAADGQLCPVEIICSYVEFDGQGYCCAIARDISERRRVQQALRDSEERFRLLAQNAQDVVFRFEFLPYPRYTYISPSVAAMLGYTPDEFYSDPNLPIHIVHPEDRPAFEAMVRGQTTPPPVFVIRFVHRNGATVWTEQRCTSFFSPDQKLVAVEGVTRDVTQRHRAEMSLRESEEKYRQLFELQSDPVFLIENSTGRILETNAAACARSLTFLV